MGKSKKKCTLCGTTKPMSDFSVHTTASDGKQSRCRACINTVMKKRRREGMDLHNASLRTHKARKTALDYLIEDSNRFLQTLPGSQLWQNLKQ